MPSSTRRCTLLQSQVFGLTDENGVMIVGGLVQCGCGDEGGPYCLNTICTACEVTVKQLYEERPGDLAFNDTDGLIIFCGMAGWVLVGDALGAAWSGAGPRSQSAKPSNQITQISTGKQGKHLQPLGSVLAAINKGLTGACKKRLCAMMQKGAGPGFDMLPWMPKKTAEKLVLLVAEVQDESSEKLSASIASMRRQQHDHMDRLMRQEAQVRRIVLDMQNLPAELLAQAETSLHQRLAQLEDSIVARAAEERKPFFALKSDVAEAKLELASLRTDFSARYEEIYAWQAGAAVRMDTSDALAASRHEASEARHARSEQEQRETRALLESLLASYEELQRIAGRPSVVGKLAACLGPQQARDGPGTPAPDWLLAAAAECGIAMTPHAQEARSPQRVQRPVSPDVITSPLPAMLTPAALTFTTPVARRTSVARPASGLEPRSRINNAEFEAALVARDAANDEKTNLFMKKVVITSAVFFVVSLLLMVAAVFFLTR